MVTIYALDGNTYDILCTYFDFKFYYQISRFGNEVIIPKEYIVTIEDSDVSITDSRNGRTYTILSNNYYKLEVR